jgi:subtilisin-like proprotein convertase family protein
MNLNETSSNDVVVALFTGATCGTATEVGAACQTNDNANFALAANTQYWFLVALTSADDCPTASPNPNYAFSFTFTATTGACCISGVCSLQTASGCATNGGTFIGGSCTGPLNGTEYNSGNTFPIAIPDNSPTGASTTVVISGSGDTVGSEGIAVKLGLTHTWVGDLVITISNGAITRTIMSRVGDSVGGGLGDSSNLSGNYLFLDTGGDFWAAAAAVDGSTNVPTGNYRATGALNAVVNLADFNGQPLDGTWTAFATDNASGDLGSFTAFSIRKATTTPVCPTAPPCPEDIDDSGFVDADDIFAFLNIWFAGPPGGTCTGCTADWDGDGTITADDIFAYLNDWFAFGPGNPCP